MLCRNRDGGVGQDVINNHAAMMRFMKSDTFGEELVLNQDNPKAVEDSWGQKRATPELLTNSVGGK